jgi:O-antigen/teichoic acid export membrane protein
MHLNEIYTWLRHPGESLSQRVVHAGFWAFTLRITSRLFGLARTIVLARLLAPNDFGLYGIALLSLSTLETFSQTGFDQALIQKKEDTKPYLDTAWTVQVIRGFVLATLLALGAPLVGSFFGEPRAVLLVRVLGAAVLLKSLRNIGIVYFKKELEFHTQFIYEFSGTFADLAVAIPAAIILRSVWALVFGLLVGNFVRMVVSYFVHSYRPRLRLEWVKAKELFTFGQWLLGSSIVVFLAVQGDDIFLGKFIGATALGFYQMAFRFSNLMTTEITHVISQVTFPVYSKLQDNIPKLREGFFKTVEATTSLTLPLTAGIFILAPDFVRLFLGEKWMPLVPALRILSISGLIRSITATGGPLFLAVNRPNMDFGMNVGRVGVMAIAIYPLTRMFGMNGTATTVALGISATVPVWWFVSSGIVDSDFRGLLKCMFFPLIGTAFMSFFILLIIHILEKVAFGGFILSILVGVTTYLAFQFYLWKRFHHGPIGSLQILKRSL